MASPHVFEGSQYIIPLKDVQHIAKDPRDGYEDDITVVMKSSTWNGELDCYNNALYLYGEDTTDFITAWYAYLDAIIEGE